MAFNYDNARSLMDAAIQTQSMAHQRVEFNVDIHAKMAEATVDKAEQSIARSRGTGRSGQAHILDVYS